MTQVRPAVGGVTVALAVALGAAAAWMLREPGPEPSAPTPPAAAEVIDRPALPEARDAMLHLRLVGDPGGQPVAMKVCLWRLGLPETDRWTAGDEVEPHVTIPERGVDLVLAAGRYRLQCLGLRRGASDPPAFDVPAGANDRVIGVAHRRTVRFRLLIVDESGMSLRQALQRSLGTNTSESFDPPMAAQRWQRPRAPRSKDVEPHMGCGSRVGGNYSDQSFPGDAVAMPVEADWRGYFDLGRRQEQGTSQVSDWGFEYLPPLRASVTVRADDGIGVDSTFVAVAPRLDALLAQVDRPDGRPLDAAESRVSATCAALRFGWEVPSDAWRTAAVQVQVACHGFRPLTFFWTAATASERHVLEAE